MTMEIGSTMIGNAVFFTRLLLPATTWSESPMHMAVNCHTMIPAIRTGGETLTLMIRRKTK